MKNNPAKSTKTFIFTANIQFWIIILNGIKKWRDFDPRILHHHRQITWVTFNEPPQLPRHETGILWPQKVVITHLGNSASAAHCQFSSVKVLIFWEGQIFVTFSEYLNFNVRKRVKYGPNCCGLLRTSEF